MLRFDSITSCCLRVPTTNSCGPPLMTQFESAGRRRLSHQTAALATVRKSANESAIVHKSATTPLPMIYAFCLPFISHISASHLLTLHHRRYDLWIYACIERHNCPTPPVTLDCIGFSVLLLITRCRCNVDLSFYVAPAEFRLDSVICNLFLNSRLQNS